MSYVALYRKFRPAKFSEVKGQDHVVKTLRNQLKNNKIAHAYLFNGTRGTGKTSVAKLLAKAANCENPVDGDPCGCCPSCEAIAKGASLNVIEIDAASNRGVDDVRQIIEEVQYSPTTGKYKIYIIDEVHMLTKEAFNALLKTLEEPPEYAVFILATTEVNKLPITILSRCQRYDFRRITIDTITDRMKELMEAEGQQVEEKALRYIAKVADGSMRDALSLLDQCLAFYFEGELTYERALEVLGAVDTSIFGRLYDKVTDGDTVGSLELVNEVVALGKELTQFVNDFTWYLRNILLVMTTDNVTDDMMEMSAENIELLKAHAGKVDQSEIIRYINVFSELSGSLKYASQKQILLEIAIIKLTKPQMKNDYESLISRVSNLERMIESGNFAAAAPTKMQETASAPTKEIKELDIAVPEEVQWVADNFGKINDKLSGLLKSYFRKNEIKVSSDGGEKLLLVMDKFVSDSLLNQQVDKKVRDAIASVLEKQVDVEIRVLEANENYNDKFKQLIKMPIEEEM